MYGLQGMTSAPMEMKQLIAAIGMKLSETDEVDAVSVGNCMYSLQVIFIIITLRLQYALLIENRVVLLFYSNIFGITHLFFPPKFMEMHVL